MSPVGATNKTFGRHWRFPTPSELATKIDALETEWMEKREEMQWIH